MAGERRRQLTPCEELEPQANEVRVGGHDIDLGRHSSHWQCAMVVAVRVGGASVRVLQAKQRACRRIRRRAYIMLRKKVGKKREARGHHHPWDRTRSLLDWRSKSCIICNHRH